MSTVTAVKKNGYVAIAADTQVSAGAMKMLATYNKTHQKILRVGDSFLGMTGWMVNLQVMESLFRNGQPPAFANSAEIFDVFRTVHARLRDEYFLNPRTDPTDPYESSQMNVLIANPHGIFTIGSLRTVNEYESFWASGSGMEYALGAMHALYDKTTDVVAIAEAGVRAAAEFDAATSAPIESYVVCQAPAVLEEFDLLLKV